MSSRPSAEGHASRRQPRLGELLLEMDLITTQQLQEVLHAQQTDRRRLGVLLVERGWVNESRLVKALSMQLGVDICDPITAPVHEIARSKISRQLAHDLGVVPIAIKRGPSGEVLFVATSDPLNIHAKQRLIDETGVQVEWLLAGETEIELALARHYGTQPPSFVLESLPPLSLSSPPGSHAPAPMLRSSEPTPLPPAALSPLMGLPDVDASQTTPDLVGLHDVPDVSSALQSVPPGDDTLLEVGGRLSMPMRRVEADQELGMPAQASEPPRPLVFPGKDESWGDLVTGEIPMADSLPPPSVPPPGAMRNSEPMIETVDQVFMTGDFVPTTRAVRGSLAPPELEMPISAEEEAALDELSIEEPVSFSSEDGEADDYLDSLGGSEPPFLELSPEDVIPGLSSAPARARSSHPTEVGDLNELEAPAAFGSPIVSDPVALRSGLSGDEVDNIVDVLNEVIEVGDAAAIEEGLRLSSAPPQPTTEQEVRMMSAQLRQELRDLIRGEATSEAKTRVLRVVVALLEREGYFDNERLDRIVRDVFFSEQLH